MCEAEEVAEGVVRLVVKKNQSCFSFGCQNVEKDAIFAFHQTARVFIRYLSIRAHKLSNASNMAPLKATDVLKAVENIDFSHLSNLLKSSFHVIKKSKSFPPLFPPESGDDDESDVEDIAHNNLLITADNGENEFGEEDDKLFENWERVLALNVFTDAVKDDPEIIGGGIHAHELPCDEDYDCHVCKKARAAARYAVKRFNECAVLSSPLHFTVLQPTKIVRLIYYETCGDPYLFYITLETDDNHLFEAKVDIECTPFRCKLFRPAQCFKNEDVDCKFLPV
ncbi:Histone-fold containing protein [Trema orientale]|uniref:Histone-fold containing protein n=1 Tax=Trema orientale TaxID=63057 RepID=A0A2P5F5W3_TREOI|nr:Histone-fold containing protein [Trema orientale]